MPPTYGPKAYNVDINQLGASGFPRFAVNQDPPYKDGVVVDIITDENHPQYDKEFGTNIGMVQVRIIPDNRGVPKEELNWAMPLETSIREYPLKNEIVMIFYSVGRIFYSRRVNINNKLTESSWPGLNDAFSLPPSTPNISEQMTIAAKGGPSYRPWGSSQSTDLGDEFAENPSVRMVRPIQGDMIIQGRYGNIIRFGSSVFSNPITPTPRANLLITVGQQDRGSTVSTNVPSMHSLVYEDINKDKNCIWMVTDETIDLDPATGEVSAHLRSSEGSKSDKYNGAGIFINSDRIIINSKVNEISLFSKKEINLSSVELITLDSNKSVMITATNDVKINAERDVLIKGRTISLIATRDISYKTSGNYVISGKKIFIGSEGDETQPLVLGTALAEWLTTLIETLSSATILTSTGPAFFNPTVLGKLTNLYKDLGGFLGSPKSAKFNSTNKFTSK